MAKPTATSKMRETENVTAALDAGDAGAASAAKGLVSARRRVDELSDEVDVLSESLVKADQRLAAAELAHASKLEDVASAHKFEVVEIKATHKAELDKALDKVASLEAKLKRVQDKLNE